MNARDGRGETPLDRDVALLRRDVEQMEADNRERDKRIGALERFQTWSVASWTTAGAMLGFLGALIKDWLGKS